MVLSNIWAMSRDERIYPNPHRFNPDRFLSTDKTQAVLDPLPTFGFGRRICVGRFLAEETLWIGVTTLLTCFNITKAKDNLGNEIFVSGEYDDKLISHPLPFKCSITPRSEETVKLIRSLS
ncbi:hypothetical protein ONZ45_g12701 [Pleurotus djamor]|nr:hypothetical protein ONZ45_g12701 [Pleurotus djamor]